MPITFVLLIRRVRRSVEALLTRRCLYGSLTAAAIPVSVPCGVGTVAVFVGSYARGVFAFDLVFTVITISAKTRQNAVIIKNFKKIQKSVDIVFEVVYAICGSGNPSCSTRVPLVVTRDSASNHYML